ncbi:MULTISPECIES: response regulator [unclassified Imperialibacter]|uniref:hybrid sensor histidine kinase/response regulator n=1 Tax=unclassified Imperialibacter TaxID=2629706 RepID=UPI00125940BE|nr:MULTISPECIES: response regulator [unclassified Imperialibacter]CAD5271174.1 Signal transduction histidine kinase [Imperialibacter sp. 75]CAD5298515.1 Signal transduction histidine kinase [Imperialibacter sp. 89]VVT35640.1 Signal transduction histidine kinase [Imperialibacter sp. EC-SDR9]
MSRFLFFVGVLTTFISFSLHADAEKPTATKGTLDLRGWDFLRDGPIKLDGEWGFYWKELLEPEGAELAKKPPHYFQFPRIWNNAEVDGIELSRAGYATYSLTVLLPKDHPALLMWVEDFFTSYQLFINGEVFSKNGIVGKTREESQPQSYPKTKPLREKADTLHLVLQVSNFIHRKGGSSQSITLGEEMQLARAKEVELAYDWILAGAMFMGGFFFFGLYLFGRHDKPMLYFALFCLVYAYRNIGSDIYAINAVWEMPFSLLLRLEHLSVFMGLYFFVRYIISLYPEEVYKPVFSVFLWVTLGISLLTVAGPILLFTSILPYYLYVLLLAICYGIYIVVMAVIHKRPAAVYALVAKLIVFAIVGYNVLVYFDLTPRIVLFNFIAHILFFFCQGLILSFRFAQNLKEAKEQAEKASRARTEFLSTMSHEMRTPLNAVLGMTNFLIEDKPKQTQKESLNTLKFSAERLMNLITELLDFSKIDSGQIDFSTEKISLKEFLRSVYTSFEKTAKQKQLDFQLQIADDVPDDILCDKARLSQVLVNLLDNAFKFTASGFVRLKVSLEEKESDSVKLLFEVIDSGIGIKESQSEMIFESFSQGNASTTREYGGTGLGLSIIRRLLTLQGSDIQFVSTPGEGSRFYFSQWFGLVRTAEKLPAPVVPKVIDRNIVESKKILVVEDNKVNVLVIKKFLQKWGANIEIAVNGQIAVEKHRATPFDIILMDLQMPVMDGYKATEKIRETDAKTPIIAITAAIPSDIRDQIFTVGMNDIVTKPFVPEDLHEKLIKYLSQAS